MQRTIMRKEMYFDELNGSERVSNQATTGVYYIVGLP